MKTLGLRSLACLAGVLTAVLATAQDTPAAAPTPREIVVSGELRKTSETKVDRKTKRKYKQARLILIGADKKVKYLSFKLPKGTQTPDLEPLLNKQVTLKGQGFDYVKGRRNVLRVVRLDSLTLAVSEAPAADDGEIDADEFLPEE